jgi:hypothetical protein
MVVNVRGKGVRKGRQVSVEKMSESEPSDDASSRIQVTFKLSGTAASASNRSHRVWIRSARRWRSVNHSPALLDYLGTQFVG